MLEWSTKRINPAAAVRQQQTTRTAPPSQTGRIAAATTRQSTAAGPIGSRGGAFRAAESQRGAPAQRGPTKAADNTGDDDPDENEWPEKEPLFSRDEDKDDDGADDGSTNSPDLDDINPDDENPNNQKKKVKG
ncbi:MAG: hypothetical protein WAL99_01390 [Pseudonocardiaceae bacterium]